MRALLHRRTVRVRLTALIGGLFVLAAAGLDAFTYFLVRHSSDRYVFVEGKGGQGVASIRRGSDSQKLLTHPFSHLSPTQQHLAEQLRAQAVHQRALDLHDLLLWSIVGLAVMAVIAVVVGWFVAGRMLRPLRDMTGTTRRISERNLHERLAIDGPEDEVKELADTIDGLLARLETAFAAQRHFIANVSHELRTPITLDRTLIELALADPDATVASLRATCDDLLVSSEEKEQLIDALLALFTGERGVDEKRPLDLGVIVEDVLASAAVQARGSGIRIDEDLRPAPTTGDPLLVKRLVANLVDNAVRHNADGGEVVVATRVEDRTAVLTVGNTGPVVPPDGVERILEPFQRLGADRTGADGGHGLGLSIVQAIAAGHDATLTLAPRPAGGLDVTLRFPLRADPRPRRPARAAEETKRAPV